MTCKVAQHELPKKLLATAFLCLFPFVHVHSRQAVGPSDPRLPIESPDLLPKIHTRWPFLREPGDTSIWNDMSIALIFKKQPPPD